MYRFRKSVCLLVTFCVLFSFAAMPANASPDYSEDPMAQKNYAEFGAPAAETEAVELAATEPAEEPTEETTEEPGETEPPQETIPVESLSAETIPTETAAEAEDSDAPAGHNGVPLYFQTDYPNNMYGIGTIANNGCSAACLAMVATYMTGHEYLPDEIARYFGGAAENNIARLELGSETMQLPFEKAKNWHDTIAALEEGKVVIALMGATSLFTDSQHFIVLTGFNEEGKIMVNDPLESNYDKWDIRKGLRTGFDKEAILLGYSGAWIYDKSAMPEEPFLYSEPLPVRGEPRYNFELTWEEIQLLAKVVWVEARGECDEHSVIRYSNGVRTDYENGTQVVKYSNGEGALNINGSTLEWHETMEQSSGVFQSFIRTDSYQNPYNSNNGGSNQSGSNSGGQTSDEAIYELVLDAFKREIRTSHGYTGAAVIYHGATASNKSLTYNSSTNTYKCEMIASYWTNIFDIWGTSKEDYYVSAEIKSLNGNWVVTAITLG